MTIEKDWAEIIHSYQYVFNSTEGLDYKDCKVVVKELLAYKVKVKCNYLECRKSDCACNDKGYIEKTVKEILDGV